MGNSATKGTTAVAVLFNQPSAWCSRGPPGDQASRAWETAFTASQAWTARLPSSSGRQWLDFTVSQRLRGASRYLPATSNGLRKTAVAGGIGLSPACTSSEIGIRTSPNRCLQVALGQVAHGLPVELELLDVLIHWTLHGRTVAPVRMVRPGRVLARPYSGVSRRRSAIEKLLLAKRGLPSHASARRMGVAWRSATSKRTVRYPKKTPWTQRLCC